MIKKIFATKSLTNNPFDGVDNAIKSIFSRTDPKKILFFTDAPKDFIDNGSIRHFTVFGKNFVLKLIKKFFIFIKEKPGFIWGIGNNWEISFLLFKSKKTKYIINWHTILAKKSDYWKVKTPWFFRKFLFSRSDKVICASEFIAQSVKKYFPNKNIVSILNGVDIDFFNPSKKNLEYLNENFGININKPLIVFIGILHPRKRPDFFIELAKDCPDANFVAVGRKIGGYDFLEKTEELNNFYWIEKMFRGDIAVLLASAHIMAFPSLNDPAAAVIGEAMASGTVVMVSDSGGSGEFIKNGGNGIIIPVNSDEKKAFLNQISIILKDNELKNRLSKNARITAVSDFSFDKVAKMYENNIV